MNVRRISKLKSAALVFAMLIFAAVAVLGGVAVGDEQDDEQDDEHNDEHDDAQTNGEQPILEISKIMTSGKTTVPVRTREYWTLEIAVTYNGQGNINNVKVDDKIPKRVELIGATSSKGPVNLEIKEDDNEGVKERKGGKITWDIGTMAPGDKETLVLELTANFEKKGEYSLNKGATVASKVGETKVKAGPTDQITVYAEGEEKHKHKRKGGMGKDRDDDRDGGRWR